MDDDGGVNGYIIGNRKVPKDPITITNKGFRVDGKLMEPDKEYPLTYKDSNYILIKHKDGSIDLYEIP